MSDAPVQTTDPELASLPEPRRRGRRLTLATMATTAGASLALAISLSSSARFALHEGGPREIGELSPAGPTADLDNQWVLMRAGLEDQAIEYRRPLDPDYFRLARVRGRDDLWIEVRVPADIERSHFVPPTSFVGRLIRFGSAGVRHTEVASVIERVNGQDISPHEWLLVDGEAPQGSRWVLGVVGLLLAFAAFNLWGVVHLARPLRDT
jgi:hypothetical protein